VASGDQQKTAFVTQDEPSCGSKESRLSNPEVTLLRHLATCGVIHIHLEPQLQKSAKFIVRRTNSATSYPA